MSTPTVKGYPAMAQGQVLAPFTYEQSKLGGHDVGVSVTHCGLCSTDIHGIDNHHGVITCPFVPGNDNTCVSALRRRLVLVLIVVAVLALALSGCSPTSSPSLFLTIIEPADESILDVNTVTIRGQTLAGAIVSINGDPADVDSNGNFSLPVVLEEGPNIFDIIATNQAGDEATSQLIVYFTP